MSTRVGVLSEGPIDQTIIAPLLRAVARERAHLQWPIRPEDAAEILRMRPRGHGGVWQAVKRLVKVLDQTSSPYAFVVILLDHRTARIQEKVRKLIAGRGRFVLAVAKEEVEAWWIGDRVNTLAWLGFTAAPPDARYAVHGYIAERDANPKLTLHELTERSARVERVYGEGNLDLARDFVELWEGRVRLDGIQSQCPERFPLFCQAATQAFQTVKRAARQMRQGGLFGTR
jgi:hypothetical protein